VTFSTDAKSFQENKDKDMFTAESMVGWASQYVSPEERDNYSEPGRADADWWKNAPVNSALMVCGDCEMFRDDIVIFASTLEKAGLILEFVNCPLQVHVDCTLDAGSGMEPGLMSTSVWDWFNTIF
jgi:acetyl esterase/lipase